MFAVRLVNAAAGVGALDLYITAPGADLTNTAPTISNVAFGGATAFISVNTAPNFEIRFTPVGTKTVIYDTAPRIFTEHSGTTVVAYSKGSGSLVNVALLNDDGAGTGAILDNLLARYKIVNASLVGSPLNVFVDGDDVRLLAGLDTAIAPTATILLLPAVAGGEEGAMTPQVAAPSPRAHDSATPLA